MKYVSIDIETTGIDREKCQILSVGAVIEDTNDIKPIKDLPRFHVAIKLQDRQGFYGEPVALAMNAELISNIVKHSKAKTVEESDALSRELGIKFVEEGLIATEFYHWLYANGVIENVGTIGTSINHEEYRKVPYVGRSNPPKAVINVAGKNFGTFDKIFLERLPRWKQLIEVRNRILDPAILFVDWTEDKALPGLDLCKKRAQVPGSVTHNAVEDAMDVVAVLRKIYS